MYMTNPNLWHISTIFRSLLNNNGIRTHNSKNLKVHRLHLDDGEIILVRRFRFETFFACETDTALQ